MSPGILPRCDPRDGIRPGSVGGAVSSLIIGPSASEVMIGRYGISEEDAEQYKKDHRLFGCAAVFNGAIWGLVMAAAALWVDHSIYLVFDDEWLLFRYLLCSVICLVASSYFLHRFRKGARA